MTDFKMNPVTSGNIAAMGYDKDSKTLRVRFATGTSYDYSDVSPEMFSGLQGADSIGSHLHKNIKPHCTANRCKGG